MTDLDSRGLRFTDMFGQKFSQPGLVSYHLLPTATRLVAMDLSDTEYVIEVRPERQPDELTRQHDVNVRLADGQLVAEPPQLSISVGDVVTWHTPDGDTPPYMVEGVGPAGAFGNASMSEQAIYTHAFGLPGVYLWSDPNGSQLRGQVEVHEARPNTHAESSAWMKSISTAQLVHVARGEIVAGQKVAVPVGGTVCWAIESAHSMAVTDIRLLEIHPEPRQPTKQVHPAPAKDVTAVPAR